LTVAVENYKRDCDCNGSIVSVDMDVVGVMAAYLPVLRVFVVHCIERHDRTITVILTKHYIKLPDDGSLVIRNMLAQF